MDFSEAVLKVFQCALVDAHKAARKHDVDAETEFRNVATALQIAYPREVKAAYEMAGIPMDDSSPARR